MNAAVLQAIAVVKRGGIIIYPTDTAFGIGCRIDDHAAVDRLFTLRKRPLDMPTPVLVSSPDMALAYFDTESLIVRRLMKNHWPGALTIVAPCKVKKIYSPIRGSGATIGLRMPDHEIPLTIIDGVGVPVIGTSANFHGEPTAFAYQELDKTLIKLVDFVVPGVCKHRTASTVVDCSVDPYKIIRQGAITL